jgi:hypothetical protein
MHNVNVTSRRWLAGKSLWALVSQICLMTRKEKLLPSAPAAYKQDNIRL